MERDRERERERASKRWRYKKEKEKDTFDKLIINLKILCLLIRLQDGTGVAFAAALALRIAELMGATACGRLSWCGTLHFDLEYGRIVTLSGRILYMRGIGRSSCSCSNRCSRCCCR